VTYLFFSFGNFFEAEDFADGKSPAELQAVWRQHRAAILERYLAEHRARGWPGCRPDYFWGELTEPRRTTAPGKYPSQRVWDRQRHVYDWVEDDLEYLRRLGLLEPWELAATPAPLQVAEG
jgi:hypothetical protein